MELWFICFCIGLFLAALGFGCGIFATHRLDKEEDILDNHASVQKWEKVQGMCCAFLLVGFFVLVFSLALRSVTLLINGG